MKWLLWSKFIIFFLIFLFGCGQLLGGGAGHCSQYKYDEDEETWVDAFNKPVNCTLADNQRFFEYMPGQGCKFWKEQYQMDDTVTFKEMVVRSGKKGSALGRKYCVLQRYISRDDSGQVLLIDEGAFCFTAHPTMKNNYIFTTCKDKKEEDKEKEEED